jgi:hypothetical protein
LVTNFSQQSPFFHFRGRLSPFSSSAYKQLRGVEHEHNNQTSINTNIWDCRDEAMAITRLRHVGIFSPDLSKQREFYGTIWGLDQIAEESDAIYFRGASLSIVC